MPDQDPKPQAEPTTEPASEATEEDLGTVAGGVNVEFNAIVPKLPQLDRRFTGLGRNLTNA